MGQDVAPGTVSRLGVKLRWPPTTVRWRLTLLYGGLFLAAGVVLLALTYTLVAHAAITPAHRRLSDFPPEIQRLLRTPDGRALLTPVGSRQRVADLHQLLAASGIALACMTGGSALLGWVVAGRVLRPLRTITATTQRISETNLHERLALPGPRDELGRLGETIDGLLERLETFFEAQRRFVANASHELRTPLTTMRATLDVALRKPNVPPQLRAVDASLRADLDQADGLLESFLVLARAQHDQLGQQASVSLDQLAERSIASHGEAIALKRIELHTVLTPARVTGSATLLARMVDNVIDNAVRHNQLHGFINARSEIDGQTTRLLVESAGPVLEDGAVAQLAQPFRRLAAERTGSQNGHGLGLSIVAAIVSAHGGSLELHARPEGGLRVQIKLPSGNSPQPYPAE